MDIKKILDEVADKNPEMAAGLLLVCLKAKTIDEYITNNKDELNEIVNVQMTRGELFYVLGACLSAVSISAGDNIVDMTGRYHMIAFDNRVDIVNKLALLAKSLGHPDPSVLTSAQTITHKVKEYSEMIGEVYVKVKNGECTLEEALESGRRG